MLSHSFHLWSQTLTSSKAGLYPHLWDAAVLQQNQQKEQSGVNMDPVWNVNNQNRNIPIICRLLDFDGAELADFPDHYISLLLIYQHQ